MVRCAVLSSLGASGCKARQPEPPPTLSAYVPRRAAERVMVQMLNVAARNGWALSIRTDSEAIGEVDLIVVDSAGKLGARARPGSPQSDAARRLAAATGLPIR